MIAVVAVLAVLLPARMVVAVFKEAGVRIYARSPQNSAGWHRRRIPQGETAGAAAL